MCNAEQIKELFGLFNPDFSNQQVTEFVPVYETQYLNLPKTPCLLCRTNLSHNNKERQTKSSKGQRYK